jgi:hypothetical protein
MRQFLNGDLFYYYKAPSQIKQASGIFRVRVSRVLTRGNRKIKIYQSSGGIIYTKEWETKTPKKSALAVRDELFSELSKQKEPEHICE